MKILTESEQFTPTQIEKIEARYEAKYVCETCVKGTDGQWANESVSIFYQPDPTKIPEEGSPWFGLFWKYPGVTADNAVTATVMICNAVTAVETDIDGIVAKNGDVIYSRYRHDYRWSPDKSVMIDGGRDYTRHNLGGPIITLRIFRDKLIIVKDA